MINVTILSKNNLELNLLILLKLYLSLHPLHLKYSKKN